MPLPKTMTSIIQIPPQKAPKQLTARSASHNLHEHFLAFLNSNNVAGFSNDEIPPVELDEIACIEADTIVDLLVTVSQYDTVPDSMFKKLAKRLKKTSGGAIKHARALEIVARVFGYAHWYQVTKARESNAGIIRNRRNRSTMNLRKLLGTDVSASM